MLLGTQRHNPRRQLPKTEIGTFTFTLPGLFGRKLVDERKFAKSSLSCTWFAAFSKYNRWSLKLGDLLKDPSCGNYMRARACSNIVLAEWRWWRTSSSWNISFLRFAGISRLWGEEEFAQLQWTWAAAAWEWSGPLLPQECPFWSLYVPGGRNLCRRPGLLLVRWCSLSPWWPAPGPNSFSP